MAGQGAVHAEAAAQEGADCLLCSAAFSAPHQQLLSVSSSPGRRQLCAAVKTLALDQSAWALEIRLFHILAACSWVKGLMCPSLNFLISKMSFVGVSVKGQ